MKSVLFIFAILVVALFIPASFAAEQVTLVYGDFTAGGQIIYDYHARQAERFMALHPDVKIEIIRLEGADKLATLIASGVQVDVTDGHTGLTTSLARKGAFLDLGPLIARDAQLAPRNFIPSSIEDFMMQGMQWAIPGQAQPWITFYNEDILQKAGVLNPNKLGAQWTWANVIAMGRKLTSDSNGDGTPETYAAWAPTDILRSTVWVRQAGGYLFDQVVNGTKPTFTTPEVTVAWQFFQSLFKEHNVADPTTPGKNWRAGKIAWNFRDANYEIGPLSQEATFSWDIARLPKGPVNDTTAVGGAGYQILSHSTHVKESLEWIKFLVTDKESARDFMKVSGRVSAYLPNAREYSRIMEGVLKNLEVSLAYMMEPHVKPRDVNPYFDDISKVVNPIIVRMTKGEISVAEAQQQAQHAAEVAMGLK